jgi:Ion channel
LIPAIILSFLLGSASALIHFESLKLLSDYLPHATLIETRAKVLAALSGAMVSHLIQIVLFAAAYHLLRDSFDLGGFNGHFKNAFSSFFYFSIETYTSLGIGDIYPSGSLRLVTGIEALIGLLMIGWTASFTYIEMRRYWNGAEPVSQRNPEDGTSGSLSAPARFSRECVRSAAGRAHRRRRPGRTTRADAPPR